MVFILNFRLFQAISRILFKSATIEKFFVSFHVPHAIFENLSLELWATLCRGS